MELALAPTSAAQQDAAQQTGFNFPASLTEKYRPLEPSAFVGLDKVRKLASNLIAHPKSCSLLFVGPSGTGKTTMALAIAAMMPAELHHIASKDCTLETVTRVVGRCHTFPHDPWDITRVCKMHLVLVDEADQMSHSAQVAFLSLLDGTEFPPNTIFIFTCNSADGLEDRFKSRCFPVEFSSYGIAAPTAALLKAIWEKETAPAPTAPAPNFARIVKDAGNNVRAAISGETEYSRQVEAFEALLALAGTDGRTALGLLNRAYAHAPRTQLIETAAAALLTKLDDMTTREFERGGEREEREALRRALETA